MSDAGSESFLSRWSRRKRSGTSPSLRDRLGRSSGIPGREPAGEKAHASDAADRPAPPVAPVAEVSGETGAGAPSAKHLDPSHQQPGGDAVAGEDSGEHAGSEHACEQHPADDAASEPQGVFDDVDLAKLDFSSDYTRFMDHDVPDDVRNSALRKLWVSNPVLANMDGLDDYCEDYTDAAVCLPKGVMKTAYEYGRGFLDDNEVAEWEKLGRPEEELGETDQSAQEPAEYDAPEDALMADDALMAGHADQSASASDADEVARQDSGPGEVEVAGDDAETNSNADHSATPARLA